MSIKLEKDYERYVTCADPGVIRLDHHLPTLKVQRLDERAKLPTRQSTKAAGYDLYSIEEVTIGVSAVVRTGIAVEMPPNCYGRLAIRSGHSVKYKLEVGAGVIDADYRGEIMVHVYNRGGKAYKLAAGERFAQLVLERNLTPEIEEVGTLSTSARGADGFGSTGTS